MKSNVVKEARRNMKDIVVTNIDEAFLRIEAEEDVKSELSDFFSFMAPNYFFNPKYKKKVWDGKIRLFKTKGSKLPSGLYTILSKFCEDNNYNIVDNRQVNTNSLDEDIDDFLPRLNVFSDGKKIEHYDYQVDAIKRALNGRKKTILSPTSSGKSLILYSISRYLEHKTEGKILILVPTVNLVSQMYTDFMDYSTNNGWNADHNIHCIFEGKEKKSDKKIFVSTWQSIYNLNNKYFEQFDVILCDEVHLASASSITKIMDNAINASYRLGFTGTLKDMKLHQLCIIGLFGDIEKVASTRELMDRGFITPLKTKFLILKYNDSVCKEIHAKRKIGEDKEGNNLYRDNFRNEVDFITSCEKRNIFIANLVQHLEGNVLVLFTKVEKHGKPLFNLIDKRLDKKRNVYYISGETGVVTRESIRGRLENEKNGVLIASYGTLSTGVNIKSLKYVIFASPYKSEIKVLQSIGRILRKCEGKEYAVLFDIVDDLRYKNKKNYFFKHYERRFDIYKTEKFPVSFSEYVLM